MLIALVAHRSKLEEGLERDILGQSHCEKMWLTLFSVAFGSSPLENIVQLSAAATIIFEHSFYIFDKRRYIQGQQKSVPSFYVALEQYMASPHAVTVREAVSVAVQAYEAAVTPAAHTYKEAVTTASREYEQAVTTAAHTYEEAVSTWPTWMAKLPSERLKKRAKDALEHSEEKAREVLERSKETARGALERSKEAAREALERSKEKEKKASERSKKEKEALWIQSKAELIKVILEISLKHRLKTLMLGNATQHQ